MADTANRVLSLEEVLALPHETQVWVQYKSLERISMVQTVKRFDGYVGQDLAVDRHVRLGGSLDEAAVGDALGPARGIDARDP